MLGGRGVGLLPSRKAVGAADELDTGGGMTKLEIEGMTAVGGAPTRDGDGWGTSIAPVWGGGWWKG